MQSVEVKIKKLNRFGRLPVFQHEGDVCADVYSSEGVLIGPRAFGVVCTGIASEIPEGWEAQLRSRSGLANDYGVQVHLGTIDSSYRGEWRVIIFNHNTTHYMVHDGDRIAQVAIREVPKVTFKEVDIISHSVRGIAGFGSTGT